MKEGVKYQMSYSYTKVISKQITPKNAFFHKAVQEESNNLRPPTPLSAMRISLSDADSM
jgi:hypothetical protein